MINADGECHVRFVLGKAKLAPPAAHTIPRLELGAAVLAVEIAELMESELDISADTVQFYTDSKVILGYCTTRPNVSESPPNLSSGTMSAPLRIQQTMLLDLCLQPSWLAQHGSQDPHSCPCLKRCSLQESRHMDSSTWILTQRCVLSVPPSNLGSHHFNVFFLEVSGVGHNNSGAHCPVPKG